MPETPAGWGLLVAVVLFAGFLLLKSRVALLPRDPRVADARRRIGEAKRAARAARDTKSRAGAWLDAARTALEELGNAGLSASFAKRAARAAPDDPAPIDAVITALRAAGRNRALERYLWRRLQGEIGPAYDRAFEELLSLYEGPLRKPERAAALRALRQRAAT